MHSKSPGTTQTTQPPPPRCQPPNQRRRRRSTIPSARRRRSVSRRWPPKRDSCTHRQVLARELLNWTWETVRTQLGRCLLLGLLMVAIYFGGYVVSVALSSLTGLLSGLIANQQVQVIATVLLVVVQFVWGQVYGAFLAAVSLRYALNLLRGHTDPVQGVFDVLPLLLRVILVQLVIGLLAGVVVAVAAMLVAIPVTVLGVAGQGPRLVPVLFMVTLIPLGLLAWLLVWVRFSLALPLVVDRNLGVMEALSESLRNTRGNTAAILGATLVVSVLAGMFALVTCGLGIMLSMPAWILLRGVVYLLVTGQQDAHQDPLPERTGASPFSSDAGASPFAEDFGDHLA